MSLIVDEFDRLCDNAMKAFNEELDVSYESTLIKILDFIKLHPSDKDVFIDKFKIMLSSRDSPFEAVIFCMRDLQWQEIKEYVAYSMNASEDPRSEVLRKVLDVYEKDWPDADLYDYYSADV